MGECKNTRRGGQKFDRAKKRCTLEQLGPFTGSIGYKGMRYFFPGGQERTVNAKNEDYCFLLLDNPDSIKPLEKENILICGEDIGYDTKKEIQDVLTIFGHPGSSQDGRA